MNRATAFERDVPARERAEQYRELIRWRMRGAVTTGQSGALISGISTSGAELLLRLLDGHPQCNTIPHRVRVTVNLNAPPTDPDVAWQRFVDDDVRARLERLAPPEALDPALLLPRSLYRAHFQSRLGSLDHPTEREIIDCHFWVYFHAWLDSQTLYGRTDAGLSRTTPTRSRTTRCAPRSSGSTRMGGWSPWSAPSPSVCLGVWPV